jgi:hypothetical protein
MINPTPNNVLDMLRKLPPQEQLKVISQALPEIEQSLAEARKVYKSLRGMWKDLHPSISAKEIDAARQEMWKEFPREGLA